MRKNICAEPSCIRYGRYCRTHLVDEEKELKVDTKEYLKVRKLFLIANPICGFAGCKEKATELHHKRGRVGKLLMNVRHFLGLCRKHHRYVEGHPHEAKRLGYSESRLAKELK